MLYLSRDNRAQFGIPIGDVYNAVSGNVLFLAKGKITAEALASGYNDTLQPRRAVALDQAGRLLMLFVIDGRQPNYSEGVTLAELGQIIIGCGGDTALNLDGGGSSTLVRQAQSGQPIILNSPIDNNIPGRERPVANHLGLYVSRRISNTNQ